MKWVFRALLAFCCVSIVVYSIITIITALDQIH